MGLLQALCVSITPPTSDQRSVLTSLVATDPKDRLVVKSLVAISFGFLCVQTVAIILTQWDTFVTHGGDIDYANTYSIPARIALAVIPVPVILAKCLFAERCHWVGSTILVSHCKIRPRH
mgnify:CR=1 FL=1|jgi:hypothetical protein